MCGVLGKAATPWFRQVDGMPSVSLVSLSGRHLSFAERRVGGDRAPGRRSAGAREIARRLGRSPSTISRQLRRNAAIRGGAADGLSIVPGSKLDGGFHFVMNQWRTEGTDKGGRIGFSLHDSGVERCGGP